jgi:hypothetical protein
MIVVRPFQQAAGTVRHAQPGKADKCLNFRNGVELRRSIERLTLAYPSGAHFSNP